MDVKYVARLANLPITSDQEKKLARAFDQTLKTVDVIQKLNTSGVAPVSQVTGLVNITRPDKIDRARIIKVGGYFRVKAIFGQA